MFSLFTYKTPVKFASDFIEFYVLTNLRQVKILSSILISVTVISRLIGFIYYDEVIKIEGYAEFSLGNWIQMSGAILFFALSSMALRSTKWSLQNKKNLTLLFVLFVLLISLGVSYIVSTYNTKNTLTMFLTGIVTVSLFFAITHKEIIIIATLITIVFILSMILPKISFNDKLMNVFVAVVLSFILICFSRYSYYFKSKHFVQLKELELKNLEIEKLNTQKGEILSFVAHDLRNPLNNIESLSAFLLMDNDQNSEAKMIQSSAKQAKEIINDLIEAVKFDQGDLQTKKTEIIAYLERIIKKWALNTKREILLNHNPAQIFAHINSSKLERVIDNLISNGIKFSTEDKPITITISEREDHVCLVIEDFGIGIPERLQKHIFNQFSKAGRQGLQGEKSIGLGLHISKRIVEQHGGKLLMSSTENLGTAFTILLPVC